MTTSVSSLAAVLGMLVLYGIGVAAQSGGVDHSEHVAHPASSDEGALDFTVNVAISDSEIQPSAIFVPAGRPVQLVVRNRGSVEHHYRVVGLAPHEISWLQIAEDDGTGEEHDSHHGRRFVPWRAASPAGIRPSGREVHAYVSPERRVDEVLFTASEPGTYVVRCDLHPEHVARLTVFETREVQRAAVAAINRQALSRALTKDLGSIDYPNAVGVRVEATYAPPEYASQILGDALTADLDRDAHVAMLLSERTHTSDLSRASVTPVLEINGAPVRLLDRRTVADSPHHRATVYRFARSDSFGTGHQMMTLRLASGQEATWHLPLMLPGANTAAASSGGFSDRWALVFALLGGMLAAMWPCLFQLTVYFIPALAGVAMQEAGTNDRSRRRQVLAAAFYFILGFTLVYTATGALIGYAASRLGNTSEFETWQRYIGIAAGVVVIALALRVAAKVRAPLVCRMPILSRVAHQAPATRMEMMVAGVAFATGCMTCFGSALVVGMVVYVGLAQSAIYGALVLFLFSLGMGVPLVVAAVAMARALPLLLKLERAVPWMGLASAALMAGFGVLLMSGHYMLLSEWTYRLAGGVSLVVR
jgi:cytochrome c-type biogenesis protein